jgi:hypothetical protein
MLKGNRGILKPLRHSVYHLEYKILSKHILKKDMQRDLGLASKQNIKKS